MKIQFNSYTITISQDNEYRSGWWRYEVTGFQTNHTGWAMSKKHAVEAAKDFVNKK